jgi:hypothetical protein
MLVEGAFIIAAVLVLIFLAILGAAYGLHSATRAITARLAAARRWWRLRGCHRFIGVAPAPAGSLSSPEAEAAREADLIAAHQHEFPHINDAYVRHLTDCYLIPGEDL